MHILIELRFCLINIGNSINMVLDPYPDPKKRELLKN